MSNSVISEELATLNFGALEELFDKFKSQIARLGWFERHSLVKMLNKTLENHQIEDLNYIIENSNSIYENEWIQFQDGKFLNFAKDKIAVLNIFLEKKLKEDRTILNNLPKKSTPDKLFFFNRRFAFDSKFLNFEGRMQGLKKEQKDFVIEQISEKILEEKDSDLFRNILDEAESFGNWKEVELAKLEKWEFEEKDNFNFVKKEIDNSFSFAKNKYEVITKFLQFNNSIEYLYSKFSEFNKEKEFEQIYIFALVQFEIWQEQSKAQIQT